MKFISSITFATHPTMTKPVPIWQRDHTMTFSDIQIQLDPGNPLKTGYLGRLTAKVEHPCYNATTHIYEIRAIECRDDEYTSSRYNRRIILGNLCTDTLLQGFQENTNCLNTSCPWKKVSRYGSVYHKTDRTMWCMNCWGDDMYETGLGGIAVPPFILYHSTSAESFVRNLRNCNRCHSTFAVASPTFEPPPQGQALLFMAIQRKILEDAVEAALNTSGIVGTIRSARVLEYTMPLEQKQEIVASALNPGRIERLSERTGLDAWDILENM